LETPKREGSVRKRFLDGGVTFPVVSEEVEDEGIVSDIISEVFLSVISIGGGGGGGGGREDIVNDPSEIRVSAVIIADDDENVVVAVEEDGIVLFSEDDAEGIEVFATEITEANHSSNTKRPWNKSFAREKAHFPAYFFRPKNTNSSTI